MKSFKKVLILGLFAVGFGMLAKPAMAAGSKYYVAATTYAANGSVADYTLGAYPNISGNLYVRKLVITNSTATVAQTVSIYDTCTSTTAASLKFKSYSGAASMVNPAVQVFDFLPQSFRLTSPCFNKSSTTSDINITVFYE